MTGSCYGYVTSGCTRDDGLVLQPRGCRCWESTRRCSSSTTPWLTKSDGAELPETKGLLLQEVHAALQQQYHW